jgi:hypothetical protein
MVAIVATLFLGGAPWVLAASWVGVVLIAIYSDWRVQKAEAMQAFFREKMDQVHPTAVPLMEAPPTQVDVLERRVPTVH